MNKKQIALLVFGILFAIISIVGCFYETILCIPMFSIDEQGAAGAIALILLLPVLLIASPVAAIFGFSSGDCFFSIAKRFLVNKPAVEVAD